MSPAANAGIILDSLTLSFSNSHVYQALFDDTVYEDGVFNIDNSSMAFNEYVDTLDAGHLFDVPAAGLLGNIGGGIPSMIDFTATVDDLSNGNTCSITSAATFCSGGGPGEQNTFSDVISIVWTFHTGVASPDPDPIPTPATLALFSLGLVIVGFSRRKKNSQKEVDYPIASV